MKNAFLTNIQNSVLEIFFNYLILIMLPKGHHVMAMKSLVHFKTLNRGSRPLWGQEEVPPRECLHYLLV